MTIFVVEHNDNQDLVRVTTRELEIQQKKHKTLAVSYHADPWVQIQKFIDLPIKNGDVICFAGVALRTVVWEMLAIAKEQQMNLMPGRAIDHRGIDIPAGKFFSRKPQEANDYPGIPYVMLIGDAVGAKESWSNLISLDAQQIWKLYQPEEISLHQWLSAAAALHPSWSTPSWFPMVDLSIRDLEIMPVMYATNHWSDWISFYPAAGQFKLENHAQIYPVWLDSSTKTLEHWGR